MRTLVNIFKGIYQYVIFFPVMWLTTTLTALITILFFPWKNAYWINRVQAYWARLYCWCWAIPVSISGEEHIRKGQSYVFVANHQSAWDVFLVYGWLPVIFKWMLKKELRRIPVIGTACVACGHIFVDRRHLKAAVASLKAVEKELHDGISTVIFPEGTRTEDGSVGRFKRGAFQIAMDLKLPVIPLSISGCYEVYPKHRHLISRHPIHLHIGEEIDLSQFATTEEAMDYVREKMIEHVHA